MASLIVALVASIAMPASAQEPSLPGGANTLNETHGAWTVTCAIAAPRGSKKARHCALSQTQLQSKTRARALAIELRPKGNGVSGILDLPFGLALADGVTYQLDDGEIGAPHSFRTCLPVGCLVDIAFDARAVANFKHGNALKVEATADGGQKVVFTISLDGFSSAYDRVIALMK